MATRASTVRSTLIWVGVLVLLALSLRVVFNMDASWDEETGRYLYSGNDPYYHDRTVRHIVETGEHLVFDPAINYPDGAYNPNPPLFDWTTVPVVKTLDAFGSADPVGLGLNLMVALWGALTVIPVYHLGRDLWNRTAGLWAAFFMAVSAPHIGRSVFGFADHDATTMFWIALAFAFLVKALKALKHKEYVRDWRHADARRQGLQAAYHENRVAMAWSLLAGTALAATAMTWKGYPYALAIMAIAVGFQLLQDHLKNRDSTALFLVYLIPLVMVILLPYLLYYRAFPTFLDTTIVPSLYVLVGVLVAGLILVPTRDMPSIVVFPVLALAAGIGLLLLLVVFPDAGRTIFSGLGYFEQTKLYSTIAEAQRSELGRVAASFGFFAFLAALWGLFRTVGGAWKGRAEHMLAMAWGVVAIVMAFAAARFITNAAPVMAVLMGGATAVLSARLGFAEVRRRYRKQHGQGQVGAVFSSLTWRSIASAVAIVVILVFPVTWVGVDAATSYDYEAKNDWDPKWSGAFGIDFSVGDNGWLALFNELRTYDTGLPLEERPGFIAWWDYGHWATDLGHHPTVADPFQNHYVMAGRFLASESEEEGIAWLTLLLLRDDLERNGGSFTPAVAAAIGGATGDAGLAQQLQAAPGREARFSVLNSTVIDGNGTIFDLYDAVTDATGKKVQYFGADNRMWPLGGGGIFYAPVFLANKNPDDFIRTLVPLDNGKQLVQQSYGVDKNGDSFARDEPIYVDTSVEPPVEYELFNGRAYILGKAPKIASADQEGGVAIAGNPQGLPTQKFRDSMYARGFGSVQTNLGAPGDGLSHWRAVFEHTRGLGPDVEYRQRNTVLLEYFRGVTVTGSVRDDAGSPLAGHQVSFVDSFGARHGTATTDTDGRFEVMAPFSVKDDLVFEVRSGQTVVANRTDIQFSREDAAGGSLDGVEIVVARGTVSGHVFEDTNGNGTRDAGEGGLAGIRVSSGSQNTTTGADGSFTITDVPAGVARVTASGERYGSETGEARVAPGGTATLEIPMRLAEVPVSFQVSSEEGPLEGLSFMVRGPDERPGTTGPNGTADLPLTPGDYTFEANSTVFQDGEPRRFVGETSFTVAPGSGGQTVAVVLSRADL